MAALRSRCGHYILSCGFFFFYLFSSPNLSRLRLHVYHTLTHGVALVRISDAGLRHAARGSRKIHDTKIRHLCTIAQLCQAISLQLRHYQQSTCFHNMVNFGLLAAEIGLLVWGTPANFSGFRVLAALLNSTLVVGVSQALQRWTEGTTCIRQGGHHVGH